jgi:tRNA (adenine22-N1)-methyltransferase
MNLTPRLKTIALCVDIGSRIADIGTDHAYLPVYMIENGIAESAVASDINKGPVQNALQTVEKSGMASSIEVICAPGLKGLSGRFDAIIIAGMGGLLIKQILEDDLKIVRNSVKLILQPMTNSIELRRFLCEHGYRILEEKITIEGEKFYEIIIAAPGIPEICDDEMTYEISQAMRRNRDENTKRFIEKKLYVVEQIVNQIESNSNNRATSKLQQMKHRLAMLREVYEHENQFR